MTSDDTDSPTRALLAERGNFGLAAGQLHIVKQGKVPCLADGDGSLALDPNDRYALLTKPHGHGDIHSLLHTSGLARTLLAAGVGHLVFLQDTNALVFGGIPAALGVSVSQSLAMNTLSVPRKAGDASGALMTLTSSGADGGPPARAVTVNVEYNQLDALVRGSVDSRGDYNLPSTGNSPFPGNTNQLIFHLPAYVAALEASAGAMPEFVNPKYTDASRTAFKSPTRLECMMQDFPWVLPPSDAVGFTSLDTGFYAPVKNSRSDAIKKAASGGASGGAAEGEHAVYAFNRRLLRMAGCLVSGDESAATLGGVCVPSGPRVALAPSFRPSVGITLGRLIGGAAIQVSERSSLHLEGDVVLEALELDGALEIRAAKGAKVTVRRLRVSNAGYTLHEPSSEALESMAEVTRLRGYEYKRGQVHVLAFDEPCEHVVDELVELT